ncbi:MAG: tetratricopeptide repeat protein [Bryobacterales bacterium]|nr:tetratricopeptide repeat protein [Bryobacterales bacterium]
MRSGLRLLATCAGWFAAMLCAAQSLPETAAPFEALYREAYERRLRESGPEHRDTIASLVRLGALLRSHGRAESAEPLLRKALETQGASSSVGPDATTELAKTLAVLGRNTEAEDLFRRSLELTQSGAQSARILLGIARLRQDNGNASGARQAYLEALEHFEEGAPLQADARKSRATALNDLGLLLEAQGELDEAEEAYLSSAEVHAEEFGNGHPATAAVRANLASTLAMRGETHQAAALLQQSLAVIRAAFGSGHDEAARLHNRLGEILEVLGRMEDAEAEYLAALTVWQEPSLARGLALADLGRLAGVQGDSAAAEAALAEAIRLLEPAGDAAAVDLAEALDSYGSVLRASGRLDEAESILSKALTIRERELGASHPDVALSLVGMAGVLHLRGDLAGAGPLYRRALGIQQESLAPDHPDVGETLYNLAHLRRALGDIAGARDAFERSAEILSVAYGPDDPFVVEIRAALRALP